MKNEPMHDPLQSYFINKAPALKKLVAKEVLVFFISIGSAIILSTFFCFTQQTINEELILNAGALVFFVSYPCRLTYKLIRWALKTTRSS